MPEQPKQSVDLVLEGGGVKGIALLGAVLGLSDAGYRFERIAGTSAGAIVGALVAAYQRAGRDLQDLVPVMREVNYRRFEDGNRLQKAVGQVGDGWEVLLHKGAHTGDYLIQWLGPLLADVDVRTFRDLRLPPDEGSSLAAHQRYSLVVHTSDLTRKALVRLPWDYHHYTKVADDQSVVHAVRASMSVPFFFRPVTVDSGNGSCTWVDGGLLSNFPITVFDRTDDKPERWPTFGIKLSAKPTITAEDEPLNSAAKIALACLHTMTSDDTNRYSLDTDDGINKRTIYVDTSGFQSLDFGIQPQAQETLYEAGRSAAATFLARRRGVRHLAEA
ncbi:patatin-like phospholipase family protein [Antrihabitans cavernicola]|uniref:Patatin-like phospholipase family protein n=1 Tax=Antrihabitans cavernicola TaxID=2495913 RepID=A0A5A7SHT1_9NOCA|nr:patatin-like phospholipase family protein [Spelaeibacter cavernicola]KAA0024722.1 patatin-like phospholipase family protein [Spelaeibacter cavernicola]